MVNACSKAIQWGDYLHAANACCASLDARATSTRYIRARTSRSADPDTQARMKRHQDAATYIAVFETGGVSIVSQMLPLGNLHEIRWVCRVDFMLVQ